MRKNKYMRHRAGIRKCLAIGLTAAMCMAMLAGCSTSQSTSSTSGTEVTSDVSTETDADKESPKGSADAENTSVKTEMTVEEMQAAIDGAMSDAAIDITDMFTKRDLSGSYDESEAVKITLSGKTAACNKFKCSDRGWSGDDQSGRCIRSVRDTHRWHHRGGCGR